MSQSKKMVSCEAPFFVQVWLHYFYYHTLRQSFVAGLASSLPKCGMAFGMYLNSTSKADQNLISNLLAIYRINPQQALVGNNCLSTVIYFPGL